MRFAEDRHRGPGNWVQFTNVVDVVGVVHRLTDAHAFARAAQIAERRHLMYGVNLQFEPNNSHDRNAIAVIGAADCPGLFGTKAKEWKIGYLPRDVAADVVSELIEANLAASVELYSIYRTDRYLEIRVIVLAPPGHSHSARMKRKSGSRSEASVADSAHCEERTESRWGRVTGLSQNFVCSYCLYSKPLVEQSDEHIWPDALGGDPLGWPWRTRNVCHRCNSLAGQWVDGAFIKSWFGSHERCSGTEDYLDPKTPQKSVAPLAYMGLVDHPELKANEVADVWLGPAGETILHVRPKHEEAWNTYAGGKPTKKRREGGCAYLTFTSGVPYWAQLALWSFQRHFKFARRTLINAKTLGDSPFAPIDPDDSEQARHLEIAGSLKGEISTQFVISIDFSTRFLVKLALGVGREVWGDAFLGAEYTRHLAEALWERDFETRQTIPVRGSGFLGGLTQALENAPLQWTGGWVLILVSIGGKACIVVVTPSGKAMNILVADNPALIENAGPFSEEGCVYLAIPAAGEVAGPISLPEYLAFLVNATDHPVLQRLQALRRDPSRLPKKR